MKTKKELERAVNSYKAGNQESFEKLYMLSYPYLYTCVSHIIKDNNIIMDMLQETYLEISRSIFQLKESKDFLKWAAVIANRKCLAYLKKNDKIVLTAEDDTEKEIFETIADDEAFIPEELFQNREKRRLIREIIDELNEVQRLCVIGYYYNEQKQEEIAQELGIPVNTVKSHLNRAKEKIKSAVLNLQEKKGTKLYCFTPFMLLYFAKEAGECKLTGASERLLLDLQGGIFGVGNKDETEREKTGSNRMKFIIPVIISVLFTVMILACGREETYESPDRLDELFVEEEAVKQEPAKETAEPEQKKPSLEEYEEKEPHRYEEYLTSQEDWKQIYLQWLNSDEWLEECESRYGDSPENMVFWFEEWEGAKTPILCMYNELYASTEVNCYMISGGEVKWFGWFGDAAMGYMEMFLINGGEYYFACNATSYCDGTLYRIVDGEVETVWNIFWNDSEFSGEDEADYLIDTPKCTFMGNDMSKEESMAQVDTLLGAGAAEQLRNRLLLSCGIEAQENGPLLLQGMEIAWDNIYHYDQLQDISNFEIGGS